MTFQVQFFFFFFLFPENKYFFHFITGGVTNFTHFHFFSLEVRHWIVDTWSSFRKPPTATDGDDDDNDDDDNRIDFIYFCFGTAIKINASPEENDLLFLRNELVDWLPPDARPQSLFDMFFFLIFSLLENNKLITFILLLFHNKAQWLHT